MNRPCLPCRRLWGALLSCLLASAASAAITTTGSVSPSYPGGAPDPWDAGGALDVAVNGAGSLTITQGSAVSAINSLVGGLSAGNGTVAIDGAGSSLELTGALSLGSSITGGQGAVSLAGAGSRLLVGSDAAAASAGLNPSETALVVAGFSLQIQLNLEAGSTLQIDGNSYLAMGENESAAALLNGSGTVWHSTGSVHVGGAGSAWVSLDQGATLSAGGAIDVGSGGDVFGDGHLSGNVTNGGLIEPGSGVGDLAVTGSFQQSSLGTLQLQLGGRGAGEFDTLTVDGTVDLAGTLAVGLFDLGGGLLAPQPGDAFEILTATGGVSGTFTSFSLPGLTPGLAWQVHYLSNSVVLAATYPGDFNIDGVVDGADLGQWQQDYGVSPNSDANLDAASNGADFLIWQRNYGLGASSVTAIPEIPSASLSLIGVALLWLALAPSKRRG
ncbi:MAG: hypothetical protein KDA44_22760 [Planctomycetales bacterium]|nr:hypothetical protein [Planctomycetales bacterium]